MEHRELSSAPCDDLEGWDAGHGCEGGPRGRGYIIRIADSLCCTAETNTTSNYTPILKKKTYQSEYDSVNWLRVNLGQQYIQISKNHMLSMCLKET